jgi:hypothetical protein|tara:strand:- start:5333 stop:5482 length:150 start_codon:yes stop_codon:yes gene_type:complete
MSIHIYAEHCDFLEEENQKLKAEIKFLQELLNIKTLGLPLTEDQDSDII